MRTQVFLLVLGVAWLTPASPALAEPITVDSGWINFQWNGGANTFNSEGPFTFTSSGPTTLTVTALFLIGNQFAVYDGGTLLGDTSAPVTSSLSYTSDPNIALADPTYSHGVFILPAGTHSLTFETVQVPPDTTGGGAYFRVDSGITTQTPEPTTLVLAGLGLGGVLTAFARGRRTSKRAATPQ